MFLHIIRNNYKMKTDLILALFAAVVFMASETSADVPDCPGPQCNCYCEFGRVLDGNGCPLCQCRKRECGLWMCHMECKYGFKNDDGGCPYCACRDEPFVPSEKDNQCSNA